MAWTNDDWNNIIQQVNEVLQNPPPDTDCEPLPTIDEVGPNHIWTKGDIEQVQDALKATCSDIAFSPIPNLWKQSIIDEITDAIGQAWCDCEPDEEPECDESTVETENGQEFLLYDNGPPKVVSACIGTDTPPIPLASLIHGMQFGQSGIVTRIWRVFRRNHRNDGGLSQTVIASGVLSCEGIASYIGTAQVATAAGIGVFCSDCNSEGCAEALADAEAHLGDPNIFYSTYVLVLDTQLASCADCSPSAPGGEE